MFSVSVISSGRFSLTAKDLDSSSLKGRRTIADLFFIVESAVIVVGHPQGFVLRGVDDASIIIQHNTTGQWSYQGWKVHDS
jgi:hypothetical protein